MKLIKSKPTTPGTRHRLTPRLTLSKVKPKKTLLITKKKITGRNNSGIITIRHRGGAHKRFLRVVDFKRQNFDIPGVIETIEYDPNRSANIALIKYQNGVYAYILAPQDIKIGATVISGSKAEVEVGNCLPLSNIPVGTAIHNLELNPGKGGQIVRSAGSAAYIQAKDGDFVTIKLPSNETRIFKKICMATIGAVSNPDHKNRNLGKAGRKRHLGWRPTVRGVAQDPRSHPHGGGEGRSGIGMKAPKSPWGKRTLGVKTRKPKYSDKFIIKHRRAK